VLLSVATGVAVAVLVVAASRVGDDSSPDGIVLLAGVAASAAVWSAGYAIQLAGVEPASKLFWHGVTWLGVAGMVVAWPAFAVAYAAGDGWLTRWRVALGSVVPAAMALFVWLPPYRWLVVGEATVVTVDGFARLVTTPGPLSAVFLAYAYVVAVAAAVLLAREAVTGGVSAGSRRSCFWRRDCCRWRSGWSGSRGWSRGGGWTRRRSRSWCRWCWWRGGCSGIGSWSRCRWRGVWWSRRYATGWWCWTRTGGWWTRTRRRGGCWATASRWSAGPPGTCSRGGRGWSTASPTWSRGRSSYRSTRAWSRGRSRRRYPPSRTAAAIRGYAVVVRDVTARSRHEQRLQMLNRVLRHDLRNWVNVVRGHAELLLDRVSNPGGAEAVMDASRDLVELSRKASLVDASREGDRTAEVVDVADGVATEVERARREFPAATFEVDAPESALAYVDPHVDAAIANLVENAVEHHDGDEPRVRVSVAETPSYVEVEVADDGPGVPEREHEVLREGVETPLERGSGLGLWLVNWIVTRSSGDLSIESTPTGSVVRVRFRRAE
jgi:two-component sensor histidine kinase